MELTRDKFQEAEYFLDQMEERVSEASFRYYLNAFVSAARSTTYVFQKEYKSGVHGKVFREWYGEMSGGCNPTPPEPGTVQARMQDAPLFEFMSELRNTALHEGLPLTTATMFTDTDISPAAVELLSKEGFPEPQVILETKDGKFIGSTIGYAWKLEERGVWTTLFSLNQDGEWVEVMGISDLDHELSNLRCRYSFEYLNGEKSHNEMGESSRDVNIVISRLCKQYFQEIDSILQEWERYLADELSEDDLVEK